MSYVIEISIYVSLLFQIIGSSFCWKMESDPLALDSSNIKEEPGIIDEFEPENKKIKLNLDIQNPDIEQDDTVTIKTEVLDDNFELESVLYPVGR